MIQENILYFFSIIGQYFTWIRIPILNTKSGSSNSKGGSFAEPYFWPTS
jgi:hypothetical protein